VNDIYQFTIYNILKVKSAHSFRLQDFQPQVGDLLSDELRTINGWKTTYNSDYSGFSLSSVKFKEDSN